MSSAVKLFSDIDSFRSIICQNPLFIPLLNYHIGAVMYYGVSNLWDPRSTNCRLELLRPHVRSVDTTVCQEELHADLEQGCLVPLHGRAQTGQANLSIGIVS